MDRKIIQIAVALSESNGSAGRERLYALADDGTLWMRTPPTSKGIVQWVQVEPIPQSKEVKPID